MSAAVVIVPVAGSIETTLFSFGNASRKAVAGPEPPTAVFMSLNQEPVGTKNSSLQAEMLELLWSVRQRPLLQSAIAGRRAR
jgi:hypothetical protein